MADDETKEAPKSADEPNKEAQAKEARAKAEQARKERDALRERMNMEMFQAIADRQPEATTKAVRALKAAFPNDEIVNREYNGISPICAAVYAGDIGVFRALRAEGASLGTSWEKQLLPAHVAAYEGKEAFMDEILKTQEGRDTLKVLDPSQNTPLVAASKRGQTRQIEQIMATAEGRQTLNTVCEMGHSALGWASINGRKALIEYYCKQPDIVVTDRDINAYSAYAKEDMKPLMRETKARQEARAAIQKALGVQGGDDQQMGHGTKLLLQGGEIRFP